MKTTYQVNVFTRRLLFFSILIILAVSIDTINQVFKNKILNDFSNIYSLLYLISIFVFCIFLFNSFGKSLKIDADKIIVKKGKLNKEIVIMLEYSILEIYTSKIQIITNSGNKYFIKENMLSKDSYTRFLMDLKSIFYIKKLEIRNLTTAST